MYEDYEPIELDEQEAEDMWTMADFFHDAMMEEKAIEEMKKGETEEDA